MGIPLIELAILLVAGAAGGYLAGLVGVGGGIIYAPVLLFYYRLIGLEDPLLTPLVLGTSLFCVLGAALSGVYAQRRARAIHWHTAATTGVIAAVLILLTGRFLTTQPWYDQRAFQIVLGVVLVWVVVKMLRPGRTEAPLAGDVPAKPSLPTLAGIGSGVGVLVAAAGVGGGVLLVPLYDRLLRFPLKHAMATSLATIAFVSLAGVATYAILGIGVEAPVGVVGYVDVYRGLVLGLPATVFARWGVRTAQRTEVRIIRYVFAAVAGLVAVRLMYDGLLG